MLKAKDAKEKPDPKKPKIACKHEDRADVDFMEHTMLCPGCDELGEAVGGGLWGCVNPACKHNGVKMKPSAWNRASIMGRI